MKKRNVHARSRKAPRNVTACGLKDSGRFQLTQEPAEVTCGQCKKVPYIRAGL